MGKLDDKLNSVIDDNLEDVLQKDDKKEALVVEQGINHSTLATSLASIKGNTDNLGDTVKAALGDAEALATDSVSDASYIYEGYAPVGTATSAGAWLIRKVPKVAGATNNKKLYAAVTNGVVSKIQVWDDRTTLSYT